MVQRVFRSSGEWVEPMRRSRTVDPPPIKHGPATGDNSIRIENESGRRDIGDFSVVGQLNLPVTDFSVILPRIKSRFIDLRKEKPHAVKEKIPRQGQEPQAKER